RQLFRQAEQAFKSRRYTQFNRLRNQLADYPLYPYLEYKNLSRKLASLDKQQIDNFLEKNDGTVIANRFRRTLINYYARHKRWHELLDVYQLPASTSQQCKYLQALMHTGRQEEAFPQIEKLWLVGKSQPKACDSLFKSWDAAGLRTEELVLERIVLAMKKSKYRLARFLSKSLNTADRQLVNQWIKIHHKPELAGSLQLAESHPLHSTIMLHAIRRMSRKDPDQAGELWYELNTRFTFSTEETYRAYQYVGLAMARQHHPDAALWLASIPAGYPGSSAYVNEWLIRTAIRQANWPQVVSAIENLPLKKQARLRWQFWWAYANDQLGNDIEAEATYRYLSGKRSYYGFLAADRLHLPYAFENNPLDINTRELLSIHQYPETLRAHELFKLGKVSDSRREWLSLVSSLTEKQKLAASKLAQLWEWHDRAIVTMGQTKYRDDIALRFPMPLQNEVETYSQKRSIESAWTYAIIRRESAFMADAKSPVGALGLMQIMPGTARNVARNLQVRYRGRHSLLGADTNIKLGTGYLEQMLDRLDSQTVLATAAYNAGPRRVESWLPESQPMNAIRWIETIPFTETREYVSNVLAYTIIYQHIRNEQYTRLDMRMPPVPARNPPVQTVQIDNTSAADKS
ncbi:MAG: transglycosylase SLT domain-containing protein, partial [Gammaproteobacteria bacterium]|nr:transglycosylase SLT domain-containing protein [Gammaproteobacteria bacterium]